MIHRRRITEWSHCAVVTAHSTLALAVAALLGCESTPEAPAPAPLRPDASARRIGIALPGDAYGAWWDDRERALYLVDDTHDALVRWTASAGFTRVAALPPSSAFTGLTRLLDGRFIVASFGFGVDGRLDVIAPGGEVAAVPHVDRTRRRSGIAVAPDGAMYVAYFTAQPARGGIARLDPARGELDVFADGLVKPVGIAVTSTAVVVSDQLDNAIYAYDPRTGARRKLAQLVEPDLLTALPNGDVIAGTRDGTLVRITPAGATSIIASGFEEVRGTAYDVERKRLFVIEHSVASSNHQLHMLALER